MSRELELSEEMDSESKKGRFVVDDSVEECTPSLVGGKAYNLWQLTVRLSYQQCQVPPFFCVATPAFERFIEENGLEPSLRPNKADLQASSEAASSAIMGGVLPATLVEQISSRLSEPPFRDEFVAVRSSGTDEDSAHHSFAGQFESYLFQRGVSQVCEAVKRCWCSCFSSRVMSHRLECGLPVTGMKMGVVIQVMVNSEMSGVGFSRHPLKPLSSDVSLIEAVFGLGEGLVSGLLEADRYEVSRSNHSVTFDVADKTEELVRREEGGVVSREVEPERRKVRVLSDDQAKKIAEMLLVLEDELGRPQDVEWGMETGQLYCLQTRPIVTLLPSCFFDHSASGSHATLWDNSNIVESYSGVTSPLTFSFISKAYHDVYALTLKASGVPPNVIQSHEPYLSNMLGLIRGNVYYNLMNWYRCLACMPVGDTSSYMDTMMGVKQALSPDLAAQLGEVNKTAPKYGIWTKVKVLVKLMHTIYTIDSHVDSFFLNFNRHYGDAMATNFNKLNLMEQVAYMKHLFKVVLGKWEVPIYNDVYTMLFFGILKSLVAKWVVTDSSKAQSLQNDLLCGQGDVESTEPTKSLMRIAEYIDSHQEGEELRAWFMEDKESVLDLLATTAGHSKSNGEVAPQPSSNGGLRRRKVVRFVSSLDPPKGPLAKAKKNVVESIQRFLNKYGFRCINELKLEEKTLHDDPSFVIDTIAGYIKTKSYSIGNMEERERAIREGAEKVVAGTLSMPRDWFFRWVLFHARRGVKHRENLRFARTKLYGVFRDVIRAMGGNLVQLGLLEDRQDVFYLTLEELYAYVDGRCITNNFKGLVQLRKEEYNGYRKGLPPPERFMTQGATGPYQLFPQLLEDANLLKDLGTESDDPNVLHGTPCCPGSVVGLVRVATSIEETAGLNGEILVTARTDPGWVPLYPLCSGLAIERGSLLSHSAVVARELGLPTIVSVSGGLMKKLKTGMKVHLEAGKGTLTILDMDKEADPLEGRDPVEVTDPVRSAGRDEGSDGTEGTSGTVGDKEGGGHGKESSDICDVLLEGFSGTGEGPGTSDRES